MERGRGRRAGARGEARPGPTWRRLHGTKRQQTATTTCSGAARDALLKGGLTDGVVSLTRVNRAEGARRG